MADHPLRPARDRRLGEPLPHLLANPIWVHPIVQGPKSPALVRRHYAVLATVSSSYPLYRADPIHYSPVRRSSARKQAFPVTARLACVRPAASVQSEP